MLIVLFSDGWFAKRSEEVSGETSLSRYALGGVKGQRIPSWNTTLTSGREMQTHISAGQRSMIIWAQKLFGKSFGIKQLFEISMTPVSGYIMHSPSLNLQMIANDIYTTWSAWGDRLSSCILSACASACRGARVGIKDSVVPITCLLSVAALGQLPPHPLTPTSSGAIPQTYDDWSCHNSHRYRG